MSFCLTVLTVVLFCKYWDHVWLFENYQSRQWMIPLYFNFKSGQNCYHFKERPLNRGYQPMHALESAKTLIGSLGPNSKYCGQHFFVLATTSRKVLRFIILLLRFIKFEKLTFPDAVRREWQPADFADAFCKKPPKFFWGIIILIARDPFCLQKMPSFAMMVAELSPHPQQATTNKKKSNTSLQHYLTKIFGWPIAIKQLLKLQYLMLHEGKLEALP